MLLPPNQRVDRTVAGPCRFVACREGLTRCRDGVAELTAPVGHLQRSSAQYYEMYGADERADEPRARRIRATISRSTRPGRRTPARMAAHAASRTTRFANRRAGLGEPGGSSRPDHGNRAIESRQAGGSSARWVIAHI